MISISGTMNLESFMNSMNDKIRESEEYNFLGKNNSFEKFKDEILEYFILKPVILYVPNRTLVVNISNENIENFIDHVHYIEDIYSLIYMHQNFNNVSLKKHEISVVIIEANKSIKKTRFLQNITFLEYFLKRNNQNQCVPSGLLNFQKLENIFLKINKKESIKKLLKKGQKYFYSSIFNLNLPENRTKTIYQRLKYFKEPKSIDDEMYDYENAYMYKCQICNNQHKVYLAKDNKNKKNLTSNFIKKNEDLKAYEFMCGHDNTKHAGKTNFCISIEKLRLEDNTSSLHQINSIFLYMFYIASNDGSGIVYVTNNKNRIKISMEDYFEKYDKKS